MQVGAVDGMAISLLSLFFLYSFFLFLNSTKVVQVFLTLQVRGIIRVGRGRSLHPFIDRIPFPSTFMSKWMFFFLITDF